MFALIISIFAVAFCLTWFWVSMTSKKISDHLSAKSDKNLADLGNKVAEEFKTLSRAVSSYSSQPVHKVENPLMAPPMHVAISEPADGTVRVFGFLLRNDNTMQSQIVMMQANTSREARILAMTAVEKVVGKSSDWKMVTETRVDVDVKRDNGKTYVPKQIQEYVSHLMYVRDKFADDGEKKVVDGIISKLSAKYDNTIGQQAQGLHK